MVKDAGEDVSLFEMPNKIHTFEVYGIKCAIVEAKLHVEVTPKIVEEVHYLSSIGYKTAICYSINDFAKYLHRWLAEGERKTNKGKK